MSTRARFRIQNTLFVLLFLSALALAGLLSQRHSWQADWTFGARNTLSADSQTLLGRLSGPVGITAYTRENPRLKEAVRILIGRYQRYKSDIQLQFVNPDLAPDQVREIGISGEGEVVIAYDGRSEHLPGLSEQALTNALQRLSRKGKRLMLFLTGHGERSPSGKANHDYGTWGAELRRAGLNWQEINLAQSPEINPEAAGLVLAGPQVGLLAGETARLQQYIKGGGNLIWLRDPAQDESPQALADLLEIHGLPGIVVDADAGVFGLDNPAMVVASEYPQHALTAGLSSITLFPMSLALEAGIGGDWDRKPVLTTQDRTWTETGEIEGAVRYDPEAGETRGPLIIGYALERVRPDWTGDMADPTAPRQRVLVMGDGDFVSNAYIGNAGNLDLGMAMGNWLAGAQSSMSIRPKAAPDQNLQLSEKQLIGIGLFFLIGLPVLLAGAGLTIWLMRRKR